MTTIGCSWCCFWIAKLITPESSFADVQQKIKCSNSIISHCNQSVIVEHRVSCFYTLANFWLWNHFCIWTIPKLCHVKFSTVLHHFQSAHEHNWLYTVCEFTESFSALVLPCTRAFSQPPLKSCWIRERNTIREINIKWIPLVLFPLFQ